MVCPLIDVVAVVLIVFALYAAVGKKQVTERLVSTLEHPPADEIAHEVEPGKFQAAEVVLASPAAGEQIPENLGKL